MTPLDTRNVGRLKIRKNRVWPNIRIRGECTRRDRASRPISFLFEQPAEPSFPFAGRRRRRHRVLVVVVAAVGGLARPTVRVADGNRQPFVGRRNVVVPAFVVRRPRVRGFGRGGGHLVVVILVRRERIPADDHKGLFSHSSDVTVPWQARGSTGRDFYSQWSRLHPLSSLRVVAKMTVFSENELLMIALLVLDEEEEEEKKVVKRRMWHGRIGQ